MLPDNSIHVIAAPMQAFRNADDSDGRFVFATARSPVYTYHNVRESGLARKVRVVSKFLAIAAQNLERTRFCDPLDFPSSSHDNKLGEIGRTKAMSLGTKV